MSFEVGQELYLVWGHSHRPASLVSVVKVGKKWVHLSNGSRMSRESMALDGGANTSPGKCYFSESEYLNEVNLNATWGEIWKKMNNCYKRPSSLTEEDLGTLLSIVSKL